MKSVLLATTVSVLAAGTAVAQDREVYVGVFTGIHSADTQNMSGANGAGASRLVENEYDESAVFGVNLGVAGAQQDWGRLRGEVELAHRENDIEGLIFNGVDRGFRDSSQTTVTTAMINAYWDSPLLSDRFRVSGGAGFGLAGVDHNIFYGPISISNSETTFAYQLIGQGEWVLSQHLSLVGDLRYLETGEFQAERFNFQSGALDSVLDTDWSGTEATIGLRYRF